MQSDGNRFRKIALKKSLSEYPKDNCRGISGKNFEYFLAAILRPKIPHFFEQNFNKKVGVGNEI